MNQILDDHSFETAQAKTAARQFFARVYTYMFGALLISGIIAFYYGTPEFIAEYFLKVTPKGASLSPLFYVVMFAPIGIALLMQSMVHRLSFPILFLLFGIYSVLIGFSLTSIFVVYDIARITSIFFVTAGVFAVMAIMGYTTKADLTKFGSILYMAFIGIFIAGLVNFFLNSDMLGYVISIIGVFVFTGLTAYHMQNLKQYALNSMDTPEEKNKIALLGGFTLYVLFINLFLTLLRLFGRE